MQPPAVQRFGQSDEIVGAVHHLSVDSTGFDNALTPVLLQFIAVESQSLTNPAGRKEHRTVALAAQVLKEQCRLRQFEVRAKQLLEGFGFYQIIGRFGCVV